TWRLVHASARVPPTLVWITPTGTLREAWRSRPKKYATAENLIADVGSASFQFGPSSTSFSTTTSSTGLACGMRWTEKRRRFLLGDSASADFTSSPLQALTDHCMFDWPEQIHTSPT